MNRKAATEAEISTCANHYISMILQSTLMLDQQKIPGGKIAKMMWYCWEAKQIIKGPWPARERRQEACRLLGIVEGAMWITNVIGTPSCGNHQN